MVGQIIRALAMTTAGVALASDIPTFAETGHNGALVADVVAWGGAGGVFSSSPPPEFLVGFFSMFRPERK